MDFFRPQDTILWYTNASEGVLGVFDKTVFVKFKIIKNLNQNLDETHQNNQKSQGKNPYQHVDFENLKKKIGESKFRDFCQMFVISKKNHTLWYGFKNVGQPDSPISHTDTSCKAGVSTACTVNNELPLNIMLCKSDILMNATLKANRFTKKFNKSRRKI